MYLRIDCYSKDNIWHIITIKEINEPTSSNGWNENTVRYFKFFGIYDIYGNFFDHTNEKSMYNKFGDKVSPIDRNKYYFIINTNHSTYFSSKSNIDIRLDYFKSDILKYQRKKQLSKILE